MKEILININDGSHHVGTIKVRHSFDMPEEVMAMLADLLAKAYGKWQEDVIKLG